MAENDIMAILREHGEDQDDCSNLGSNLQMDFDEKLINVIKGKTFLIDVSKNTHKDKILKENGWEEVAEVMGKTAEECKKKWRALRDKFQRELRISKLPSGSGVKSKKKKKWVLMEHMMFYKHFMNDKETTSNFNLELTEGDKGKESNKELDKNNLDSNTNSPAGCSNPKQMEMPPPPHAPPGNIFEDNNDDDGLYKEISDDEQQPNRTENTPKQPGGKRKPNYISKKTEIRQSKKRAANAEDPIDKAIIGLVGNNNAMIEQLSDSTTMFLLSLAPSIKKMAVMRQEECKMQIQKIVFDNLSEEFLSNAI